MFLFNLSIFTTRGYVSLDALRGLASWMVAIPHFFLFTGFKSDNLEYISILAVEIFFILSGFVLGPQLYRCLISKKFSMLKTFFLRRWLRTLPIFFIVFLIYLVFAEKVSFEKIIQTGTFTYNLFSYDYNNNFFLVAWSLAIEEWFYIIFPVLGILLFKNIKVLNFTIIFILLFMILKFYYEIFTDINYHRITLLRLDSIALGFLSFLLSDKIKAKNIHYIYLGYFLSILFLCLSYYFFSAKLLFLFIVTSNLAGILLILSLKFTDLKIYNNLYFKKTAAFFAHTSYCVYLCHPLIILIFFSSTINYTTFSLFNYVLITLIFSILSYYFIEIHFNKLKPSYVLQEKNTKNIRYTRLFISNTFIFFLLLIFLERSSGLIPKFSNYLSINGNLDKKNNISPKKNNEKYIIYKNKDLLFKDMANYPGDRYQTYITHVSDNYMSKYVNIDENGIRKNGNEIPINKQLFTVWIVGSSAIFGATNSDNETIAANLEKLLNDRNRNKTFRVLNLGVQGYNSLQDYLNIKLKLLEIELPNYILIINGYNDYYTASLSNENNIFKITRTWANSYDILYNAWGLHHRDKLINTDIIKNKAFNSFSNYLELKRLIRKWFQYRYYNNNPEIFLKNYDYNKKKAKKLFFENTSLAEKFYIDNIEMIINEAKYFNIPVGVVQQPMLINIKKELSETEKNILQHKTIELFARELSYFNNGSIPTYEVDRKYFLDLEAFKQGYKSQKNKLKELAEKEGIDFYDLEKGLSKLDNIPVFTSLVHFSFEGSKRVSEMLFNNLNKSLK